MAELDAALDPDGDLLIILRNPSTIFESLSEESEPSIDGEAITAEPESDKSPQCIPKRDWLFKASSKHLSLACPRFKKMMEGPWLEATQVHDDRMRHWVLEGFNSMALFYVLCLIHGKHRKVLMCGEHRHVSRTDIELSMLVEIARVVDYIDCYETVVFASTQWINHLEYKFYGWYNTGLILWICVTGVFGKDKSFKRSTRRAILESNSSIPTFGLPLLPEISDEIDRRRVRCLDQIFEYLYRVFDELNTKDSCSPECNATRRRVLEEYMQENSLIPRPTSPYLNLSVKQMLKILERLPDPTLLEDTMLGQTMHEHTTLEDKLDNLNREWGKTEDNRWGDVASFFEKNWPEEIYHEWLEFHYFNN